MVESKKKPSKDELRKQTSDLQERDRKKKKRGGGRPPNYHHEKTFVICPNHESGSGEDYTSVEYYCQLVFDILEQNGVEGGIQSEDSVYIKEGTHTYTERGMSKTERGIFLDLPTKKIRIFFGKCHRKDVIWDLVNYLITRR